jgi:hypothetical protein
MIRKIGLSALAGIASVALAAPGAASAATQVGHTLMPGGACSLGFTWLQLQYSAPSDGVITGWDFQAGAAPPQLKFKVGRLVSGSTYSIVGESGIVTPAASTLNHYLVRIPVKADDLIGFYTVTTGGCDQGVMNPSFTELTATGDVAPGAQASFIGEAFQMDVSASLEPDADHDGFGDETQDQCPTNASTQGPCPVSPATSVTGQRAAALKKCKKNAHKKHWTKKKLKKCKKNAQLLPV